jgi:hypothetical protein
MKRLNYGIYQKLKQKNQKFNDHMQFLCFQISFSLSFHKNLNPNQEQNLVFLIDSSLLAWLKSLSFLEKQFAMFFQKPWKTPNFKNKYMIQ